MHYPLHTELDQGIVEVFARCKTVKVGVRDGDGTDAFLWVDKSTASGVLRQKTTRDGDCRTYVSFSGKKRSKAGTSNGGRPSRRRPLPLSSSDAGLSLRTLSDFLRPSSRMLSVADTATIGPSSSEDSDLETLRGAFAFRDTPAAEIDAFSSLAPAAKAGVGP